MTSHEVMLRQRCAHERGQRRMSVGKIDTEVGVVTNGGVGLSRFCSAHSPYSRAADAMVPVTQ
jgi:hypothetical protein